MMIEIKKLQNLIQYQKQKKKYLHNKILINMMDKVNNQIIHHHKEKDYQSIIMIKLNFNQ